jgi:hypothetical protein
VPTTQATPLRRRGASTARVALGELKSITTSAPREGAGGSPLMRTPVGRPTSAPASAPSSGEPAGARGRRRGARRSAESTCSSTRRPMRPDAPAMATARRSDTRSAPPRRRRGARRRPWRRWPPRARPWAGDLRGDRPMARARPSRARGWSRRTSTRRAGAGAWCRRRGVEEVALRAIRATPCTAPGSTLLATEMTPFAPQAIIPTVRASSPQSTVSRSPSAATTDCARRMLPVASLRAMTRGQCFAISTTVSAARSAVPRVGTL